jgi:hypothetical protein
MSKKPVKWQKRAIRWCLNNNNNIYIEARVKKYAERFLLKHCKNVLYCTHSINNQFNILI